MTLGHLPRLFIPSRLSGFFPYCVAREKSFGFFVLLGEVQWELAGIEVGEVDGAEETIVDAA